MTSRELVLKTLEGKNARRAPRQMWMLPWAVNNHKAEYDRIIAAYPDDIVAIHPALHTPCQHLRGDPFEPGESVDEWGCLWENMQRGLVGEVKNPLVTDDDWNDAGNIHIPEELLSFDIAEVNAAITNTGGKFTRAGYHPRPFERLQFIRGTENLFVDLITQPAKMRAFMERMHDFYRRLLTKWAQTDVDSLMIMDDWGSQTSLLINPKLWDELFRPMYQDYIDIAHRHGKKIFMHSDGFTLEIIPRLIDMGLDALNAQIFCIGIEKLRQFRGRLTFWGEIDRQHLLASGTPADIARAVETVHANLYDNGFCIAQCEFGPGAKPENIREVFASWDRLTIGKNSANPPL